MGMQSDEVYDPYMGVEEDTRKLVDNSMSMQHTDDNTDEKSTYDISYEYCDSNALPAEETSISSLDRDKFYKLCPGLHEHEDGTIAPLGQPRCGDNSNYSFMLQRPAKEPVGGDKLLIELSGGGACWDKLSCAFQGAFLTFPIWFDQLVGSSCGNMGDGMLLCDRKVGNTDFSEYTTILIPYCTQDIHSGDNPNSSYGVQHVGAHNLYRTLQWMYTNFPDPESIFITGCSAGATPLPVVYDLINTHYDLKGENAVNIDVIADSPVFLTPANFLENYMPNWNVGTLMERIGFDFEAYQYDEEFPDAVLDHVLQRGKKTDDIGYVSHDADAISLYYYKMMSEGLGGLFGRERELSWMNQDMHKIGSQQSRRQVSPGLHARRRLDEIEDKWKNEMNSSMTEIMNEHSSFETFAMEGDGHCSFGLNVPLEYEGFEEWLTSLLDPIDVKDGNNDTFPMANGNTTTDTTAVLPTTNENDLTTDLPLDTNNAGQKVSSIFAFMIALVFFLFSNRLLMTHTTS